MSPVLISTAYMPNVEVFSLIAQADEIYIESKENYIKQTFRNRCYILSSQGKHLLSVPVYEGSRHKIPIKEVRIDYSKRWQQVHLRAIVSSYRCSPYFDYFFDPIEKIINRNHVFLWDLNMELLNALMKMIKLKKKLQPTTEFQPAGGLPNDYRYNIDPGKNLLNHRSYLQVFSARIDFVPNLSIIDLIFNLGPDAAKYLTGFLIPAAGNPENKKRLPEQPH